MAAASGPDAAPAEEAQRGEEDAGAEREGDAVAESVDEADLPEMMELCDAAEEAGEDAEALVAVIRNIGRRIRATPGDRDLLSDFEGITHVCKALSAPPHEWRGEAMLTFCRVMPDVCRTSNVNRGSLRDEGFVTGAVGLLKWAVAEGDEAAASAACVALTATCTANDGNKRAAAQLPTGAGEQAEGGEAQESGLVLLLNALGRFPDSSAFQAEGLSALRTLLTDDDPRKADCEPAAAENREVATCDAGFPFFGAAVENAFSILEASEQPQVKLCEQSLLLLREISRRHDRIHALAFGAKFLKRVLVSVGAEDPRLVRAALAVLRNFAADEEARDELALMSDGAQRCLKAVAKHMGTAAVCEQGFGLFANLTMRKSPIAAALCGGDPAVIALGLAALRAHPGRPDVARSVVHTLRNVASQEEAAAQEVKENGTFEEVRALVQQHEPEAKWKSCVGISRQFLREFRADEGMEKKAVYNAFY